MKVFFMIVLIHFPEKILILKMKFFMQLLTEDKMREPIYVSPGDPQMQVQRGTSI